MDLISSRMARLAALAVGCAAVLGAAPQLRLVSSTVGPVSIVAGASGGSLQTQTVEAYNAGDGNLNLTLTSNATWIGTSVGTSRACSSRSGQCLPLQFALNTSSLSAGSYTGIVTVSDPNAIDAPQTITVTVQIGGALPTSLDVYAAAGSRRVLSFTANGAMSGTARTNDGGGWLSLAVDGSGSFRFPWPYRLNVAPSSSMGQGDYVGTLTVSGSSFAQDNKAVQVNLHVTGQPIGQPSTNRLKVRLAQGAPAYSGAITVSNLGQGTLTVSGAKTGGATWLTVQSYTVGGLIPDGVAIAIDPKGMNTGTYSETVTITSNAAAYAGALGDTTTLAVPVDLEIVAAGAPVVDYQGVLDNAVYVAGDTIGRGDIVAVKGQQLSMKAAAVGTAPPLSTQVSDTQVLLNGTPIPIFYASYGQINCQIPTDAAVGTSLLQVKRTDGATSNTVTVNIGSRAPRLLRFNIGDYGAIVNGADGSYPMPVGSIPGYNTHPAHAGDTLIIYAIGLGDTDPMVATGAAAPSNPLAWVRAASRVNFGGGIGGTLVTPDFIGMSPTSAGLYQVNVQIPANVAKGSVYVTLGVGDTTSNAVLIAVE